MCIYSISYNPILPVYFVAALVPTALAIGSSFELAPVFFQYALLAPLPFLHMFLICQLKMFQVMLFLSVPQL